MPRYFFNLFDAGKKLEDTEGEVLADDKAARDHAAKIARDLTRENGMTQAGRWSLEILNEDGQALAVDPLRIFAE